MPMLCKEFDLDLKSICAVLNFYNIRIRSIKETRQLSEYKERIEKTNIERFGAINPLSKNTEIYHKRNKTVIDKYGCENVFQCLDLFIDNWSNNGKRSSVSSLNKKLYEILKDLDLEFTPEYKINYYDEDGKKRYKFFDAKVGNILIEANGDYWHANPEKYKPEDVFNFPKSVITSKDIWELDKYKEHIANVNGFNVLTIWEKEFKNIDYVKERIKNSINN